MPWIIRHPEGIGSGYRIDGLVQSVDLMPTLLEFMDIDAADLELTYTEPQQSGTARNIFPQDLPTHRRGIDLTGHSLAPMMRGQIDEVRDFICGGHHNREWFIKDHEWSLLLPVDGSRPPELYRLATDPGEQSNVIDQHAETAARLELGLHRFLRDLDLREAAELSG